MSFTSSLFTRLLAIAIVAGLDLALTLAGPMPSAGARTMRAPVRKDKVIEGTVAKAVDMGLSVKWADHNVGASKNTEVGAFFGYGDIERKLTTNDPNAYAIGDIIGTEQDPAFFFWEGGWRMPTEAEIRELCERCEWRWKKKDGVEGFEVMGRKGQSIFLPATGMKSGGKMQFEKIRGYYWSGETCDYSREYVPTLFFYKGGKMIKDYKKGFSFVVRPVKVN